MVSLITAACTVLFYVLYSILCVTLHPCDSFFINNRNMSANSVEKHYFAELNVKLPVKTRFKMFN